MNEFDEYKQQALTHGRDLARLEYLLGTGDNLSVCLEGEDVLVMASSGVATKLQPSTTSVSSSGRWLALSMF